MRHTKTKIRVTDHWFDAAELQAATPPATTATIPESICQCQTNATNVVKNLENLAGAQTNHGEVEKKLDNLADLAGNAPKQPLPPLRPTSYVRKGSKERGYIEEAAILVGLDLSKNATEGTEDAPIPFLDAGGCLHIPFASPRRYHWWAGGQDLVATLDELRAPAAVVRRYTTVKEFETWLMQGVL